MVGHSVTYGSSALQAAHFINGGALAALPALLTSPTKAGADAIALAAIPFIIGIAAAAIGSLAAYLNFQWAAEISWHNSEVTSAMLRHFYQKTHKTEPAPARRARFCKLVQGSFYVGVLTAMASLRSFIWGAWQFIELARLTAK
jgi:hypothetical protein